MTMNKDFIHDWGFGAILAFPILVAGIVFLGVWIGISIAVCFLVGSALISQHLRLRND